MEKFPTIVNNFLKPDEVVLFNHDIQKKNIEAGFKKLITTLNYYRKLYTNMRIIPKLVEPVNGIEFPESITIVGTLKEDSQ